MIEKKSVALKTLRVEMGMSKAILVRAEKERRNMLLESEGILYITEELLFSSRNLAELCSTIAGKAEILNVKIAYVTEEISK